MALAMTSRGWGQRGARRRSGTGTPVLLGSDVDEAATYRLLASLMYWSSVAIACSFANDILAERGGDTPHTMCGLGQRYVGWPSPMLERGRQSKIREGEGARRRFQSSGRWMCGGRAIEWVLWWFRPWMGVAKAIVVRGTNAAWEMQRKMGRRRLDSVGPVGDGGGARRRCESKWEEDRGGLNGRRFLLTIKEEVVAGAIGATVLRDGRSWREKKATAQEGVAGRRVPVDGAGSCRRGG